MAGLRGELQSPNTVQIGAGLANVQSSVYHWPHCKFYWLAPGCCTALCCCPSNSCLNSDTRAVTSAAARVACADCMGDPQSCFACIQGGTKITRAVQRQQELLADVQRQFQAMYGGGVMADSEQDDRLDNVNEALQTASDAGTDVGGGAPDQAVVRCAQCQRVCRAGAVCRDLGGARGLQ